MPTITELIVEIPRSVNDAAEWPVSLGSTILLSADESLDETGEGLGHGHSTLDAFRLSISMRGEVEDRLLSRLAHRSWTIRRYIPVCLVPFEVGAECGTIVASLRDEYLQPFERVALGPGN
ncbi:MAG: hypothetical protein K5799_10450 [Erythrobacter sp.]|nr:hypothetical protein [Erythrobacter sp.]